MEQENYVIQFNDIPNDVLKIIITNAISNNNDYLTVQLVCKRWYELIIQHPVIDIDKLGIKYIKDSNEYTDTISLLDFCEYNANVLVKYTENDKVLIEHIKDCWFKFDKKFVYAIFPYAKTHDKLYNYPAICEIIQTGVTAVGGSQLTFFSDNLKKRPSISFDVLMNLGLRKWREFKKSIKK